MGRAQGITSAALEDGAPEAAAGAGGYGGGGGRGGDAAPEAAALEDGAPEAAAAGAASQAAAADALT